MRPEYEIIVDWVKEDSTVIDLGCGDGALLGQLGYKCRGGIGLDKIYGQYIDKKETYDKYKDKQFDYAICNVTLQMVENPSILLAEMSRISKYQIISFPNFAKWQNRLELLFKGRMPRWMLCGYNWYDTGHTHQLSIKDFELYTDWTILKKLPKRPDFLIHTVIYLCE